MEEIAEHDVLAGLDRAREALLRAADGLQRGYALQDAQSRDAVERAAAVVAAAHAVYLQTIRTLDVRPHAVPGASADAVAKTFLMHRVHVDPGTAKGLVDAAHVLAADGGDLPLVGEALAEGEVTFEHVRVLAASITDQPVRSVRFLTDRLVTLLDPGRKERFDEDAHLRRGIHLSIDGTAMGTLKATLTPADTA